MWVLWVGLILVLGVGLGVVVEGWWWWWWEDVWVVLGLLGWLFVLFVVVVVELFFVFGGFCGLGELVKYGLLGLV